jgi:hypothetical protein
MSAFSSVGGDYFNWRLGGFTGYDSGLAFASQPGTMTRPVLTLWNSTIPYWLVGNGRRLVLVAKVSTVYVCAYLGLLDTTYATSGQWPYPLVVAGNMAWETEPSAGSSNWRWSYSGEESRNLWCPYAGSSTAENASQIRVRRSDGTWRGFGLQQAGSVYPYRNSMTDLRAGLDGTYPLLPIILSESTPNVLGELGPLFGTTGHALGAESVIEVGSDDYLLIPNVNRSGQSDFAALLLV